MHLIRLPSSIALPPSFRIDDAPLLPPSFLSVTRTPEETSVITSLPWKDEELPTGQHTVEGPFKLLRIRGPLELNMLSKRSY